MGLIDKLRESGKSVLARATILGAGAIGVLSGYGPQSYAGDEPRPVSVEYSTRTDIATLVDALDSGDLSERASAQWSLYEKIGECDSLGEAKTLASQVLSAYESFIKKEKIGIPGSFISEQRKYLNSLSAKVFAGHFLEVNSGRKGRIIFLDRFLEKDLVQFPGAAVLNEVLVPLENTRARIRQKITEQELRAKGVEIPEGYEVIPPDEYVVGSFEVESNHFLERMKTHGLWSQIKGDGYSGGEEAYKREAPRRKVKIQNPFLIKRNEVTNEEINQHVFRPGLAKPLFFDDISALLYGGGSLRDVIERGTFVDGFIRTYCWDRKTWESGGNGYPNGPKNRPYVFTSPSRAEAFAKAMQVKTKKSVTPVSSDLLEFKLPDAIQWEVAARGADGREWPWGNIFDIDKANTFEGESKRAITQHSVNYTNYKSEEIVFKQPNGPIHDIEYSSVGSFQSGKSPFNLNDIAGNAWELVISQNEDEKIATLGSDKRTSDKTDKEYILLKGGATGNSFSVDGTNSRCSTLHRWRNARNASFCLHVGFRPIAEIKENKIKD